MAGLPGASRICCCIRLPCGSCRLIPMWLNRTIRRRDSPTPDSRLLRSVRPAMERESATTASNMSVEDASTAPIIIGFVSCFGVATPLPNTWPIAFKHLHAVADFLGQVPKSSADVNRHSRWRNLVGRPPSRPRMAQDRMGWSRLCGLWPIPLRYRTLCPSCLELLPTPHTVSRPRDALEPRHRNRAMALDAVAIGILVDRAQGTLDIGQCR